MSVPRYQRNQETHSALEAQNNKKPSTKELLLAPNQWKMVEGIKVENTTDKICRVIITIPERD